MKYKILTIKDLDLVKELETQSKLGFDVVKFLDKILPTASSDFVGWRILFGKKQKI